MGQYPTQERDPVAGGSLAAHAVDTTGVHGIADTSLLVVEPQLDAEVEARQAHEASTTAVHGIADTSLLVVQANLDQLTPSRLGVNSTIAANTQARIVAQGSAYIPLVVRGATSQTSDLFQAQSSAAAIVAKVRSDGFFGGTGFGPLSSGAFLWMDGVAGVRVSVDAPTTKALVVRGATAQTADLQQWQDSGGFALAYVSSGGSIRSGGQVQAGTTTPQSNVKLFTVAGVATDLGLVVKGFASQTADLTQWQDSAGSVRTFVDAAGGLGTTSHLSAGVSLGLGVAQAGIVTQNATRVGLAVRGAASQTGHLQQWQDSTGAVVASVDPTGVFNAFGATTGSWGYVGRVIGDTTARTIHTVGGELRWGNGTAAHDLFMSRSAVGVLQLIGGGAATSTQLVVKGIAAQTSDLQQWQSSSGAVLHSITSSGRPGWASASLVQTTVGAAGGASALPATPTKYLQVVDNTGAVLVIPAYASV